MIKPHSLEQLIELRQFLNPDQARPPIGGCFAHLQRGNFIQGLLGSTTASAAIPGGSTALDEQLAMRLDGGCEAEIPTASKEERLGDRQRKVRQ